MQPSDTNLDLTRDSDGSPGRRRRRLLLDSQGKNENKFLLHLGLLLKKNYIVQRRSPRALLFQIIIPFIVCILINYWQHLAEDIFSGVEIDSKIIPVSNIPRCFHSLDDPNNCKTVVYSIIGTPEPWIHSVMNYVASENGLKMGEDVVYHQITSPKDYSKYLMDNLNKTDLGVIFCTSEWKLFDTVALPCKFETQTDKKLVMYNILYNVSEYIRPPAGDDFKIAHPKHPFAASLKISIDNGIIGYFSIDKEAKGNLPLDLTDKKYNLPKIRAETQDFPKTHFRFVMGSDVLSLFGCLQFGIPYMLNFLVTSFEIVREKNKRLREGLTVMGMSATSYWISWAITAFVTNLLITISTLIAGHSFGYPYFTDTPTPILFCLFFLMGMGLQALAFWISTVSANPTMAYIFSYAVLLICVVLTLFINNIGVCFLIFSRDPQPWFPAVLFLFKLVPAFNYALLFSVIGTKSGNHYDIMKNSWEKGTGFTYPDLFVEYEGNIPTLFDYKFPSAWDIFMILLRNLVLYVILTWYCDNVFAHNRGTANSPLFFLTKQYWLSLVKETSENVPQKQIPKHAVNHAEYDYKNLNIENSVETERERVIKNHQSDADCKGLRVVGIDKIYQTSMFKRSAQDIHAVKSVYLEVEDGELLSILGHNGAGKTTLIGVLTGLLKPTSGTAEMYNYDISTDLDSIRQIMGVCPQFDILWNELTAKEHLELFAKLKGIPENQIPEEIDKRLRDVNLLSVKNAQAGTFSGGMKRRLSMAIAFIGDPRIVFLDEPTTGMDPKNRRYIWELIQKMKQGRVVILTTHAMEEADILSDRIAVVSKGSLRCVGTGLYLKNKYGDGYRLSVVVDKDQVQNMSQEILKIVPSGKILDCSGGSILVGVPLVKVDELKAFFRIMENKTVTPEAIQFKAKVKDWGLSHTTLEEVFMKITSGSKH